MKRNDITDVFFDLDHTLWDFDKNSRLAFERVFQKHRIPLRLSDFIEEYEPINQKYWKLFREETINKQELRRGRLLEAFSHFSFDLPLSEIDAIAETYIIELPIDNHLFDDALEVLDYLQPSYKLHIITNGFQNVQYRKLENSGIQKYFSTITTSEEVGVKKPHLDIFCEAMKRAEAVPQTSIMIGDNIEADILGAKNAGMQTLFFNSRNEDASLAEVVIHRLNEIKRFL